MLDRGQVIAVLGVATLMILTYADVTFVFLGILAFTVAFAYAGYWGFAVRRGLVMGVYRNQALGVGFSALYVVLQGAATATIPVELGSDSAAILANALVDFGFLLVLFYWIGVTVSIARRSDPLERDTFHFRLTKYVWGVALVLPAGIALAYNPWALVYTVATPLDFLSLALAASPFIILLPFGAALLFLSASRSMDRTLNRHISWYAAALAAYLIIFAVGVVWRTTGGNPSPYGAIIDPLFLGGQFLAAYSFYRSAKSLAPIARTL
jgi:hypothetical protein